MKRSFKAFLLTFAFLLVFMSAAVYAASESKAKKSPKAAKDTVYGFTVKNSEGKKVSLSEYKGKVLLIVNTATKCGLTPQYEQLQALYEKYKDEGFEILDFPSNQFLEQAPGTDAEIDGFCTLNYGTTFSRFAKSDVNGKKASPLFVWLKKQAPQDIGNAQSKEFEEKVRQYNNITDESDIKWNFGKFLIDRNGKVAGRFSPAYEPQALEEEIKKLL